MMSAWIIIFIVYILSPFDLIPEAIFGIIGYIDDLIIFAVMILFVTNIYYDFLRNQQFR